MKIEAHAKVNLSLDVTGKRADGYHTLCSVFQSVSLCDVLTVDPADKVSVTCSKHELDGEDNLCFKAVRLFFEVTGIRSGVNIFIEKHIPEAGGLGGGSADAAATLVALNELCGRPLTQDKLSGVALKLGADVPFCMMGKTKLCEGIGEIMTDLKPLPDCFIVLAKKGIKSSTADMYRALDSAAERRRPDTEGIINGLESGVLEEIFKGAYNCFESVCDASALCEARNIAELNGAVYCGLSGAGPSVVLIFKEKQNAEAAAKELSVLEYESFVTVPCEYGVKIIE